MQALAGFGELGKKFLRVGDILLLVEVGHGGGSVCELDAELQC